MEDRNRNGQVDPGELDPRSADTDGDGIPDRLEDQNRNGRHDAGETRADLIDTDRDGIEDGIEDRNRNGRKEADETSPLNPDTDGDGLADGREDRNHDGHQNDGETSPLLIDSDGGGEDDGSEVRATRKPARSADDALPFNDRDSDGVEDLEDRNRDGERTVRRNRSCIPPIPMEMAYPMVTNSHTEGLDPLDPDTDGDGRPDGLEINAEQPTDPLSRIPMGMA